MQLIGFPFLHPLTSARKVFPANAAENPPLNDLLLYLTPNPPLKNPENLTSWLEHAWSRDPISTLKLIFHLCGSNKQGFYAAAIWLYQNHPLTLFCNIRFFLDFGSLKDLIEILNKVLVVYEAIEREKEKKRAAKKAAREVEYRSNSYRYYDSPKDSSQEKNIEEVVTESSREREIARARRVVNMYREDYRYRYLHDQISDLFVKSLKSDLEFLKSGELEKISSASKICPSVNSHYDKSTLICERIARKLFPCDSYSEYKEIEEAHYAYRVRERLRKQVLIPLREALNNNNKGPVSQPQSTKRNKPNRFFAKGFDKRIRFFVQIAARYANISDNGTLLAHQIGSEFKTETYSDAEEAQRQRLVEDWLKTKNLHNSLAIYDPSATKIGIAMGLLVSELSENPWKGKTFTFCSQPKLRKIQGEDVLSKVHFIEHLEGDEKVDFRRVFDRILQISITDKLRKDQLMKRVFVFSNRDYNEVLENYNKEEYKDVYERYRKRGYKVPEIVFWKVNEKTVNCYVVIANERGLWWTELLVVGFLKRLINLYLEREGFENLDVLMKEVPKQESVMTLSVIGKKYKDLDVGVLD